MSETVPVAITFAIDAEIVGRIRALSPRIEVLDIPAPALRPGAVLDEAERQRVLAEMVRAEVMFGPAMPNDILDAATNLRWYQVITAGVDGMVGQGLLDRPFTITKSSGLAAPAIAEWVMGAIVMLAKGMHTSVRDQADHRWQFRFTQELPGKTVGIVGMGAIGREVARRARVFGMRVVATRRRFEAGDTDPDCDQLLSHAELPSLLTASDFVVLCVPLTPETRGLIGATELALMKPTASLLNVARGAVIDQEALIAALKAGTIASAALDVTDPEPLPAESALWDLPNLILTPHISGAVEGYGHRAAAVFITNLRRYLDGDPLENVVHKEFGY